MKEAAGTLDGIIDTVSGARGLWARGSVRMPKRLELAGCRIDVGAALPTQLVCMPPTPPHLALPAARCGAAQHDLMTYLSLLKTDGRLVMVGLSPEPLEVPAFALTSRK